MQLNDQQAAAVQETSGETLLVAVPGSGKTATILARIGYLTLACDIPGQSILAITYTKAAASEMEARYRSIYSTPNDAPRFSTIHSLCLAILRDTSKRSGEKLPMLETDPGKIIRRVLYGKYATWPSDHLVRQLSTMLTLVKNRMLTANEREYLDVPELKAEVPNLAFETFFRDYEEAKKSSGIMDFDDQLLLAYETLQNDAETADYFRSRYRHIFMDEAQDTSLLQFRILELLAKDADSLFVAGDDDQSIYSFRGADPDYMLHFQDQYPNAKVFYLNTNYRSVPAIVESSNRFITINRQRYEKAATASREGDGTVDVQWKQSIKAFYADAVAAAKAAYEDSKHTLAIMARNNFTLLPLAMELDWLNIPFRRRDNYKAFFSHPTVAGVLGAIGLALRPWDLDALLNTRQLFGLYFNNAFIARLHDTVDLLSVSGMDLNVLEIAMDMSRDKPYVKRALEQLCVLLNCTQDSNPVEVIELIRHLVPPRVLKREKASGAVISSSLYFEVLAHIASTYQSLQNFSDALEVYARAKTTSSTDSPVTLTTIHSAKGLEFNSVIVLDALYGILPVDDIDSLLDPEEEARIFYVAATRAKEHLTFYVPYSFFKIPGEPSPYIERLIGASIPGAMHMERPSELGAHVLLPTGSPTIFTKTSAQASKGQIEVFTHSSSKPSQVSINGIPSEPANTQQNMVGPDDPRSAEQPNVTAAPIDLNVGDVVRHKNYGTGTILEFVEDSVRVDFEGIGIRKVVQTAVSKLEI